MHDTAPTGPPPLRALETTEDMVERPAAHPVHTDFRGTSCSVTLMDGTRITVVATTVNGAAVAHVRLNGELLGCVPMPADAPQPPA